MTRKKHGKEKNPFLFFLFRVSSVSFRGRHFETISKRSETLELEHKEITEQIIGAAFEVFRQLGHGFLEKVYQRAIPGLRVHSSLENRRIEPPRRQERQGNKREREENRKTLLSIDNRFLSNDQQVFFPIFLLDLCIFLAFLAFLAVQSLEFFFGLTTTLEFITSQAEFKRLVF